MERLWNTSIIDPTHRAGNQRRKLEPDCTRMCLAAMAGRGESQSGRLGHAARRDQIVLANHDWTLKLKANNAGAISASSSARFAPSLAWNEIICVMP